MKDSLYLRYAYNDLVQNKGINIHTTARSCDNTDRSVVRTNNGGAAGKNYYTWDCVRLTHGAADGRYTLNMYYELT